MNALGQKFAFVPDVVVLQIESTTDEQQLEGWLSNRLQITYSLRALLLLLAAIALLLVVSALPELVWGWGGLWNYRIRELS